MRSALRIVNKSMHALVEYGVFRNKDDEAQNTGHDWLGCCLGTKSLGIS